MFHWYAAMMSLHQQNNLFKQNRLYVISVNSRFYINILKSCYTGEQEVWIKYLRFNFTMCLSFGQETNIIISIYFA